jgi:hypothetical protein
VQHHYTFSLFYWLLSNWNWATVLVLSAVVGVAAKVLD